MALPLFDLARSSAGLCVLVAVSLWGAPFERLRASYAYASLGESSETDPLAQRWGLMPASDYAQALHETCERDYRPRFADFGIDAEPAWTALVSRNESPRLRA